MDWCCMWMSVNREKTKMFNTEICLNDFVMKKLLVRLGIGQGQLQRVAGQVMHPMGAVLCKAVEFSKLHIK